MRKRINTLLLILTAMMSMALSSCDSMIAYDLEGTWEGDMYMVRDGRHAIQTCIEFIGDPYHSTSGRGYWLEEYSPMPNDYFYSRIEWKVRDRKIIIYLLDDRDKYGDPFELVIRDYDLDDDRFSGYVDYAGGSREFYLYHTSSPHWNDYNYGYGYNYYYSKGKNAKDSVVAPCTHEMRQD